MSGYTVKELSALAGVSVRTLHHYDQIGLLQPSVRSEARYRYYGKKELLRLQQILFYRELDFPLHEIRELLDKEDFDLLSSLEYHREKLQQKAEQMKVLLITIDRTIENLKNNQDMMTDKELYEGFSEEQAKAYRKEASERWGEEMVAQSEERIKKMGAQGWADLKQQGERITQQLANLADQSPASAAVQNVIEQHYTYIGQFYKVTEEIYRGLGKMYVEDERFTAYYEKFRPGLAAFVNEAIQVFCEGDNIEH
ncbi:MAG TPA: MerR family transcriptional regulator [Cytophagaceae bacterium]|nr:MerR family transcriptional regulator [Cytophagaceae bacterium]